MSSIELLLLPVALMAGTSRAPAPFACPASDGGAPLANGAVYDGPIAENAQLAPDAERRIRGGTVNTWPVAYIYQAGRQVYLSCTYPNRPPVTVAVTRPVKACRYTAQGTRQRLSCS